LVSPKGVFRPPAVKLFGSVEVRNVNPHLLDQNCLFATLGWQHGRCRF